MWNSMCSSRRPIWPGRNDRGVALPGVLVFAAFLVGISGWIVGHLRTDLAMHTELEDMVGDARLAEAAVQAVALAVGQVADWRAVDALAVALPCPPAPSGVALLHEPSERLWLQRETDASSRWGVDSPRWQPLWTCHGPGLLDRWPLRGVAPSVVVWVADDPEGDGQPTWSTNQRLLLAAVARSRGGSQGVATAVIARSGPGAAVRLMAWHGAPGT
jgi:hypothetical protein